MSSAGSNRCAPLPLLILSHEFPSPGRTSSRAHRGPTAPERVEVRDHPARLLLPRPVHRAGAAGVSHAHAPQGRPVAPALRIRLVTAQPPPPRRRWTSEISPGVRGGQPIWTWTGGRDSISPRNESRIAFTSDSVGPYGVVCRQCSNARAQSAMRARGNSSQSFKIDASNSASVQAGFINGMAHHRPAFRQRPKLETRPSPCRSAMVG